MWSIWPGARRVTETGWGGVGMRAGTVSEGAMGTSRSVSGADGLGSGAWIPGVQAASRAAPTAVAPAPTAPTTLRRKTMDDTVYGGGGASDWEAENRAILAERWTVARWSNSSKPSRRF